MVSLTYVIGMPDFISLVDRHATARGFHRTHSHALDRFDAGRWRASGDHQCSLMIAAGGIGPLPALLLGVSQRPCGVFVGIVRSSILREQPAGLYRQGNFGYGGDREGGMQGRPAASIRPAEPGSYQ